MIYFKFISKKVISSDLFPFPLISSACGCVSTGNPKEAKSLMHISTGDDEPTSWIKQHEDAIQVNIFQVQFIIILEITKCRRQVNLKGSRACIGPSASANGFSESCGARQYVVCGVAACKIVLCCPMAYLLTKFSCIHLINPARREGAK